MFKEWIRKKDKKYIYFFALKIKINKSAIAMNDL